MTSNIEETQTTSDLERAIEEGRIIYDGQKPPGEPVAPLKLGESDPDSETGTASQEDPSTGTSGREPGQEDPLQQEDASPTGTTRFKSHEEAERGYRELQGKATRAEQRAAELAAELDRIQNAARIQQEKEAARMAMVDFAAERRARALEEIDGLDPEGTDYRRDAARILSAADIDIYDHYQTAGGTTASQSNRPPAAEAVTGPEKDDGMEQVVGYIQTKIVGEGLDKDDPLFWQYAGNAPITNAAGKSLTLDEQLSWALTQTKQYHTRIQAKGKERWTAEAVAANRSRQNAEIPLGRGTAASGRPGDSVGKNEDRKGPISISDALDFAMSQRRL